MGSAGKRRMKKTAHDGKANYPAKNADNALRERIWREGIKAAAKRWSPEGRARGTAAARIRGRHGQSDVHSTLSAARTELGSWRELLFQYDENVRNGRFYSEM